MFGIHLPLREIIYCKNVRIRSGDREGRIVLSTLMLAGRAVLP